MIEVTLAATHSLLAVPKLQFFLGPWLEELRADLHQSLQTPELALRFW
jgi:hypothetical protein